jgi:hypothetical protein
MPSTICSLDHPIVFVCDPSNNEMVVPEYNSSSVTSFTSSCVSIRAVAYIDGNVSIHLESNPDSMVRPEGVEVYSGHIKAPGRRMAVMDSENNNLLEIGGVGTIPLVEVFVDDQRHPTAIWIFLR